MSRRKGMTRVRGRLVWLCAVAGLLVVTGCSPSTEHAVAPPSGQLHSLSKGQPAAGGWTTIAQSVAKGEGLSQYIVNTAATVVNGRDQTVLAITGQVQPHDRTSLALSLAGQPGAFYQQGQAAFQLSGGKWTPSAPIPHIGVYSEYAKLVAAASAAGVRVVQFPRQYVIDEYCTVYEALIPAALVAHSGVTLLPPGVQPAGTALVNQNEGDVLMAFYVGERTGVLREVAYSVSTAGAGRSLVSSMNTEISSLNKQAAAVHIPPTLLHQWSGLP